MLALLLAFLEALLLCLMRSWQMLFEAIPPLVATLVDLACNISPGSESEDLPLCSALVLLHAWLCIATAIIPVALILMFQ